MSTAAAPSVAPSAHAPGDGEAIWFLGTLAVVKTSTETTAGRVAVLESLAPPGFGSPLHVHHREDEWFYVLKGELTLWVGGRTISAPAGSFAYGPRGVPHTFTITSPGPARFLLVAEPAGFEDFVRSLGEPAQTVDLPPASVRLPDPERLVAVAAEYEIEILGPPGIPA